nr:mitochondrial ATP synthase subunit G protein [Tanacetum cinerariifolium]
MRPQLIQLKKKSHQIHFHFISFDRYNGIETKAKATLASEFLSKHGSTYYKQLLEENKQYIQQPATVEKCNELSKQLFYTRLASLPARNEAFWKEVGHVKELWTKKQDLKVFTFTGYYV